MAKESPRQQRIVGRVMHEFKQGKLESSAGGRVRNPRQAVAIALSEAGASNRKPQRAEGDKDSETRAQLYARAREANIPGRSRMTRDELARALRRH